MARGARERLVFLTGHLPFPAISGGRLREYELLRRVAAHMDVRVVAVAKTYEEDAANAPALREALDGARVDVVRNGWEAAPLLETADVLHVERCFLVQHVPSRSAARSSTGGARGHSRTQRGGEPTSAPS